MHNPVNPANPVQTPLSLLLPYQRAWVADQHRFKLGLWGRQTGKSFACACEAVQDCYLRPGTMWVILSAGERQALEFVEKAKQWAAAFQLRIADCGLPPGEAEFKRGEIRFGNGSRLVALPANPDTARGYSANVILDEFAFHEDSEGIWRAIYPTITNPLRGEKKLRIVSTPNGRGNKFYDLWSKNTVAGDSLNAERTYSAHRVTIEDAAAAGLPVDLAALREGIDCEEAWQQEYLCQFIDAGSVLLPYEVITGCESDEASETGAAVADTGLPRYAGVDVGTVNDPTVCVTLERRGNGRLYVVEGLVLAGMELSQQMELLRPRLRRAARAGLDASGIGRQMAQDFARELGAKCSARVFTSAFKAEIFPRLRRCLAERTIALPVSRAWREDLHAMQETFHNGVPSYWAPRTAQGHSDRCTALALAVHETFGAHVGTFRRYPGKVGRINAARRDRSLFTYW